MITGRTLTKTLTAAIITLTISPIASGAVWFVKPGGGTGSPPSGTSWAEAFADVQTALAAANEFDEVWVQAGTYKPGSGVNDTFDMLSNVQLRGGFAGTESSNSQADPTTNVTILSGDVNDDDPSDLTDNCRVVLTCTGVQSLTLIKGFTITGGRQHGVLAEAQARPTFENVLITANGNSIEHGGGMTLAGNSEQVTNVRLIDCIFTENLAFAGGGMNIGTFSTVRATGCTFDANEAKQEEDAGLSIGGGAVRNSSQLAGSLAPTFLGCTFIENSAVVGHGGAVVNEGTARFLLCNFHGNTAEGSDTLGGGNDGLQLQWV
jgi:hypothetical protein